MCRCASELACWVNASTRHRCNRDSEGTGCRCHRDLHQKQNFEVLHAIRETKFEIKFTTAEYKKVRMHVFIVMSIWGRLLSECVPRFIWYMKSKQLQIFYGALWFDDSLMLPCEWLLDFLGKTISIAVSRETNNNWAFLIIEVTRKQTCCCAQWENYNNYKTRNCKDQEYWQTTNQKP